MILIIANARRKGGLSGSDNIYEAFAKYWQMPIDAKIVHGTYAEKICKIIDNYIVGTQSMMGIDFKPFWVCYIWRTIKACWIALRFKMGGVEFVYSASDFLMDVLPCFIYKLKGARWVAGYYMQAPKGKWLYRLSQIISEFFIHDHASVVCMTNESLFPIFPKKKRIAVHGGINLSCAGVSDKPKLYDAVFVGRLHYTKGIDKLMTIWDCVHLKRPEAKLAIIGDGDSEADKVWEWANGRKDIKMFGYRGRERFEIYKRSKMVLYPVPEEYSHFSMAPVEAMACGCPMVAFDIPVMKYIMPWGTLLTSNIYVFINHILFLLRDDYYKTVSKSATKWAQSWDWSKRAPKILNEIRGYLK